LGFCSYDVFRFGRSCLRRHHLLTIGGVQRSSDALDLACDSHPAPLNPRRGTEESDRNPIKARATVRARSQREQKLAYDVLRNQTDRQLMTSNIEPIAREITRGICRNNAMPETQIDRWVDLHWQCAAAMLEAGVMDERGEWIEGKDWRRGSEAYRERLSASSVSGPTQVDNDPS
jgi:hypothetical protein